MRSELAIWMKVYQPSSFFFFHNTIFPHLDLPHDGFNSVGSLENNHLLLHQLSLADFEKAAS